MLVDAPLISPRNVSLADVDVAFADSIQALSFARAQGLPRSASVRASSPMLVLAQPPHAEDRDRDLSPARLAALDEATLPWCESLFNTLNAVEATRPVALVAARVAINFQTMVFKSMALREDDFSRRIAIVNVDTQGTKLDPRTNFPWERILRANPNVVTLQAPAQAVAATARRTRRTGAGLLSRLQLEDWQSILYRLLLNAFDRLPVPLRGTVLVYRDNPLLKETAFQLALRLYSLRSLQAPTTKAKALDAAVAAALRAAVRPIAEDHIGRWVVGSAVAPLVDMFLARIEEAAAQYFTALDGWRAALDRVRKPVAVFCNYPLRAEAVALHAACRERQILLVSAQHGVSREINSRLTFSQAYYENISADVFLTFNRRAARVSNEECVFPHGQAISVGKPGTFFRSGRHRARRASVPPIFYVSTALYIGNIHMIQSAVTDCDKARTELDIIERVLSRLPHRVLYKPYPGLDGRYLDQDILSVAAARHANIAVYEEDIDLQYLLPDARVLIASRGTSTVATCLMAGTPFVYIDFPEQVPLREDVRALLDTALFLFDGASPALHDDVRAFLSQPLEDIEAAWRAKAAARQAVIEECIASHGPGAGRRAAGILSTLFGRTRTPALVRA